jgi:signal peptidase II
MRLRPAVWLVALLIAGLDQATKAWAIRDLSHPDGHVVPLMGRYLSLRLEYNDGAALSLLGHTTWLVTLIMLSVTVLVLWFHGRANGIFGILVFGAALGGALGNLYDRFFRGVGMGRGPVVDMINYNGYFTGNVADIAIVLAAAAVIIASWTGTNILLPPRDAATPESVSVSAPAKKTDEVNPT